MSLFHKIRLALNMAPEGLLWHLRRLGPLVTLHNVIPGSTWDPCCRDAESSSA